MLAAPTGEVSARTRETHERTIEVTSTEILRSGFSGRKWTLFAIKANDDQGQPIAEDLRSFQKLAPGTRRCVFEDYKGEAWTLKEIDPVGVTRARRSEARAKLTGQPIPSDGMLTADEFMAELAEQRKRLENLEGRLELLAGLLGASD